MTVTTASAHGLASGMKASLVLVIAGAISATDITVLTTTTFKFDSAVITADTGTCTTYYAAVAAECMTEGLETNLLSGDILALSESIATIEDTAYLPLNMSSGTDLETDEAARARVLLSRKTIRGTFTVDQCVLAGLGVAGNKQIIYDLPIIGEDATPKVAGFQPRPGEVVFYIVRESADGTIEKTYKDINTAKSFIRKWAKTQA